MPGVVAAIGRVACADSRRGLVASTPAAVLVARLVAGCPDSRAAEGLRLDGAAADALTSCGDCARTGEMEHTSETSDIRSSHYDVFHSCGWFPLIL